MQAVVRVRCTQCPKILLPSFMPKHIREEHCPPEDRSCATCGMLCKSKNILNRHKRQNSCRSSFSPAELISSDQKMFDDDSKVALPAEFMDAICTDVTDTVMPASTLTPERREQLLFGNPTTEQLQDPREALTAPSLYYSGGTPFIDLDMPAQLTSYRSFISSEAQQFQEEVYMCVN
jgi:hypothetical protein